MTLPINNSMRPFIQSFKELSPRSISSFQLTVTAVALLALACFAGYLIFTMWNSKKKPENVTKAPSDAASVPPVLNSQVPPSNDSDTSVQKKSKKSSSSKSADDDEHNDPEIQEAIRRSLLDTSGAGKKNEKSDGSTSPSSSPKTKKQQTKSAKLDDDEDFPGMNELLALTAKEAKEKEDLAKSKTGAAAKEVDGAKTGAVSGEPVDEKKTPKVDDAAEKKKKEEAEKIRELRLAKLGGKAAAPATAPTPPSSPKSPKAATAPAKKSAASKDESLLATGKLNGPHADGALKEAFERAKDKLRIVKHDVARDPDTKCASLILHFKNYHDLNIAINELKSKYGMMDIKAIDDFSQVTLTLSVDQTEKFNAIKDF